MAQARPKVNDYLLTLTNSEWRYIIDEYIKSETDRQIAIEYYLNGKPQADIGAEFNYSRSAIRDRLHKIIKIIEKNAKNKS